MLIQSDREAHTAVALKLHTQLYWLLIILEVCWIVVLLFSRVYDEVTLDDKPVTRDTLCSASYESSMSFKNGYFILGLLPHLLALVLLAVNTILAILHRRGKVVHSSGFWQCFWTIEWLVLTNTVLIRRLKFEDFTDT